MKRFNLKLHGLPLIIAMALMMSPVASADCVSKCHAGVGPCASAVVSGAGATGDAGISCVPFSIPLPGLPYDYVYTCSTNVYQNASSCGDDGSDARLLEIGVIQGDDPEGLQ